MIEKQITETEFDNTHISTPTETLKILKNKYPKEYQQTITELKEFCKNISEPIQEYTEQDIYIIFGAIDIIEYMDELIKEEILINYYSQDNCGTDKGIWEMTTRYGYAII